MVFSSIFFLLVFLPVTIILYNLSSSIKYKNFILLVVSLIFYAWGEPFWIIQMLLTGFVVWLSGLFIHRFKDKRGLAKFSLVIGLIAALSPLFLFKYSAFFISNFNLLGFYEIPVPTWTLPIGISFYTFQTISYIIDLYRGECQVQKNLFNFWLYEALFPQLIAGPIVRYVDVEREINYRQTTPEDLGLGMRRFIMGLAKKTLIANYAGSIVSQTLVSEALKNGTSLHMIIGILAFTFQIYFDFSAYSDMAIGLGRIFGFNFKENFNYPYISGSVTEFWRRWHISLGTFFRDYLYIPLGGGRKHVLRNLIVVWFLTGFWHGANWNFILWGGFNLFFLIIEKFIFGKLFDKVPRLIKMIPTFAITMLGWAIFYFEDLNELKIFISKLIMRGSTQFSNFEANRLLLQNAVFFGIAFLLAMPIIPFIKKIFVKSDESKAVSNYLYFFVQFVFVLGLFGLSVASLVGASYNPFLYFRF